MKKYKVEVCVTHYYDIFFEISENEDEDLEEKAEKLAEEYLKQHPDKKYFDTAYEIDCTTEEVK